MKIINNRFKIQGLKEEILNHESYVVEDLKNNGELKRLTFYNTEKDKKTIEFLLDNFLEIYNIKHKNLLNCYHFHIVETIDTNKVNKLMYFIVHEVHNEPLLYLEKDKLSIPMC